MRTDLGKNVFDAAMDRLEQEYRAGHRMVVSFSAGKDSNVILELALIAAEATGRLPVEAVMRDEEIQFPGTFEYAERVYERDDVDLHWLVANQPIVNAFNRKDPFWWVFDPQLPPDQWVREPPPYAEHITDLNIEAMTTKERFPPPDGKQLCAVIGLRTEESRGRLFGLHSSGGYRTKPSALTGVVGVRPIYDWKDGDVWKAIEDFHWDYNKAYDTLHRLGTKRKALRIAPPTMSASGIGILQQSAKAWPAWFDRVATRCPGVRTAAMFGRRALTPERRDGETWQETFQRECIDEAPEWIADRSRTAVARLLTQHAHHSTGPLPEVKPCPQCQGGSVGCWKALAQHMYGGEPFSVKFRFLPQVEPEFFREGAGTWGGTAAW